MNDKLEMLGVYEGLTSEEQEVLFRFIHCFHLDDEDVECLLSYIVDK